MEFLLEHTFYRCELPPPRVRDPSKPMQVICAGMPRSGTESLQVALLKLGYDYTYHGWDIMFETPHRMPAWVALGRRKYREKQKLTTADFDAVLGHATAVVDWPASAFLPDIIHAYPDAKVVMNVRRDYDAWAASIQKNLLETVYEKWSFYLAGWFTTGGYWTWMIYPRLLIPELLRWEGENPRVALRKRGRECCDEQVALVKRNIPEDRLLVWCVEDGWKPLCKFLGKPIPDEPFPRVNTAAGFEQTMKQWEVDVGKSLVRNLGLTVAGVVVLVSVAVYFLPSAYA